MLYKVSSICAILLAGTSWADMYMHFPRGSNNRLNEQSANRNNANRLFDSQNNNRGGYNVGDMDATDGFTEADYIADFSEMYNHRFLNENTDLNKQYEMLFFEGSVMSTTWTNQHGTGNSKLNSQVVLQFICDTFPRAANAGGEDGAVGPDSAITSTHFDGSRDFWTSENTQTSLSYINVATRLRKHGLRVELMNGGNTNTPDEPDELADDADGSTISANYQSNNDNNRGRRESEEYYSLCKSRYYNYGLFHADQDLNGDSQKYTRQNPGGNRRGLECPEERDYYPWWNPSPFHDIAVITPDVDWCEEMIAPESQNVKLKYQCVRADVSSTDGLAQWVPSADAVQYNLNQTACENAADHEWEGFRWNGAEPECVDSYWTKVNYLGNVDRSKRGGKMAHYDWELPSYDDLVDNHYCYPYTQTVTASGESGAEDTDQSLSCVRLMFRLRYNMSTMDYDPYMTDSSMDEDDDEEIISPIENNPTVDVGVFAQGLRLAINTAQTGRTFQDCTHTFLVCEKPASDWGDMTLLNVGVRGKRGNIVQTFPAIEYDFEPSHLELDEGTCLHFQWTGSNTHNNGAPGGDGQTGDAGQGEDGTDRHNIVQMIKLDQSYPLTYDKMDFADPDSTNADLLFDFFDYATCYHPLYRDIEVSSEDAQIILGSGGFYKSVNHAQTKVEENGDAGVLDELMNNVSPSFRQGLICCIERDIAVNGEDVKWFSFLCTRNNSFTNRSQKLKIGLMNNPGSMDDW